MTLLQRIRASQLSIRRTHIDADGPTSTQRPDGREVLQPEPHSATQRSAPWHAPGTLRDHEGYLREEGFLGVGNEERALFPILWVSCTGSLKGGKAVQVPF